MIHSRFAAGFRQVSEPGVEPPALTGVEVAAFIPFFPLLLRNRGLSPDRVGLVIATMSLSGLLASTLWGHAADMVLGRLTTLRVVAALAAGMALVLNVVGSHLAPILVATTALSACWAAIVPVGDALALHHLGAERRPAYGRIRLWMSIGFAIAAVSFGSLFERAGLGAMPSTFALALFILLVWSAVADLPSTRPPRERTAATPSARRPGPIGSPAVGDPVRGGPRHHGVSAVLTFVPLRIGGLGGTPVLVGLAVALAAAVEVPVMAFSDRVIEVIGLKGAFVLGAAQYAAAFAVLSGLSSPVAVALVVATDGIGFALVYVSTVVILDALVPPSFRATGQGLRQTVAFGIAPILGAAGGGLLYGRPVRCSWPREGSQPRVARSRGRRSRRPRCPAVEFEEGSVKDLVSRSPGKVAAARMSHATTVGTGTRG